VIHYYSSLCSLKWRLQIVKSQCQYAYWKVLGLTAECYINTLPSGHTEMCDCCPLRCWRVTYFYIFLHDALHMRFSACLAHLLLQGYRQLDAGYLGLKLQTKRPLIIPYF
jgi:hypothetical protein